MLLSGRLALAQEPEGFKLLRTVPLPGGAKLSAVDIGQVDQYVRIYAVADSSNASIDIIDLNTGNIGMIKPVGAGKLQGKQPDPNFFSPNFNDVMGPNGLVFVNHSELWVGDSPTLAAPLVKNSNPAIAYANDNCDSSVKVFSIFDQTVTDVINLGGCFRSDELDWDPADQVVLIANPGEQYIGKGPSAPFISLIDTHPVAAGKHHPILKQIAFDGTNGTPNATNGIEQPAYSPKTGLFYVAVPQNGPTDTGGVVAVVDPVALKVVNIFVLNGCGPNGASLDLGYQLYLGCTGGSIPGSQIIDIRTGQMIARISQAAGCDQVNFNPGDGHFLGDCGSALAIIDSSPASFDQKIAGVQHAGTAADPVTNQIFTAVSPNGALCGASPTTGCIAIFAAGPPIAQAILTVPSLTTSQPSMLVTGTASTTGSGRLTYQFIAVPGTTGITPLIQVTPFDGEALVYFNSGPGNYSFQLTVTDGAGNTSTSAVATVNYTGP